MTSLQPLIKNLVWLQGNTLVQLLKVFRRKKMIDDVMQASSTGVSPANLARFLGETLIDKWMKC